MITERDEKVVDILSTFQVATTRQINELVYKNMRVCQRRLSILTQNGILIRSKNLYSKEYLYSMKIVNPKQLKHRLLRTEFYLELNKVADIKEFLVEPKLQNLQPDGLILCQNKKGKAKLFALEIETANNKINTAKYEVFLDKYFEDVFKARKEDFFVVCVTTKPLPKTHINMVKVDPTLEDIDKVVGL